MNETWDNPVPITIILTTGLAAQLAVAQAKSLYPDQPGRFELLGGLELWDPGHPVFTDGTMAWCATMADLLLFRGYEEGCRHTTTLLNDFDAAGAKLPPYVVLSSRPWSHG